MRINNYVGFKTGMLKVLEKTDKRNKQNKVLYKCQCECGNIVYYNSSDLKQNISCGCWRNSRKRIDKMLNTMKYVEDTSISLIKHCNLNSNNTSGFRGVSYDKFRGKWRAYIRLKYETKALGRFNTLEEAIKARLKAEDKYYKPLIEKYSEKRKN